MSETRHQLGWQDGGSAALVTCGDVDVRERGLSLTAAEYNAGRERPKRCPNCGKLLRLVWDVRVEVVNE